MRLLRRMAVVAVVTVATATPGAPAGAASVPTTHAASVADGSGSVAARPALVLAAQSEVAQLVDVSPSADGMPGADLVRRLLSWLSQLALWGSLGSILAGATVYGIAQNSNSYNGAYRGKQLAVAGAIGAALAGLAPTAITMLFRAAGG
jgi:hypothetical protein